MSLDLSHGGGPHDRCYHANRPDLPTGPRQHL
jgi:hypothetical protein